MTPQVKNTDVALLYHFSFLAAEIDLYLAVP